MAERQKAKRRLSPAQRENQRRFAAAARSGKLRKGAKLARKAAARVSAPARKVGRKKANMAKNTKKKSGGTSRSTGPGAVALTALAPAVKIGAEILLGRHGSAPGAVEWAGLIPQAKNGAPAGDLIKRGIDMVFMETTGFNPKLGADYWGSSPRMNFVVVENIGLGLLGKAAHKAANRGGVNSGLRKIQTVTVGRPFVVV